MKIINNDINIEIELNKLIKEFIINIEFDDINDVDEFIDEFKYMIIELINNNLRYNKSLYKKEWLKWILKIY